MMTEGHSYVNKELSHFCTSMNSSNNEIIIKNNLWTLEEKYKYLRRQQSECVHVCIHSALTVVSNWIFLLNSYEFLIVDKI